MIASDTQGSPGNAAQNLYSPEAEQAVLGALLLRPAALIDVSTLLRDRYFTLEAHRTIFNAMTALGDQGLEADPVALANRLREEGSLEEPVGGAAYLQYLIESCPTSVNLITYAKIVERKALLRQLNQASLEIQDLITTEKDVEDIISEAEKSIYNIGQSRADQDLTDIRDIMRDVVRDLEKAYLDEGNTPGLPTGFPLLDDLLGGFNKSDLIVLAGRPGMGKSSLGLTVALNVAQHVRTPLQGFKVAIFSLEMSAAQLVQRLLAIESVTDLQNLRVGRFGEDHWATVQQAGSQLSKARIFIDDTPGASVTAVRSKALRLHARENIDLIMVDYLQLMTAGESGQNPRQQNRQQEITFISGAIKNLARELNVPVLALSQLSRGVEARQDKRPMLQDLRESGSIEQDADVVMFLYREKYYDQETIHGNVAELIVAKHRNGATGTVRLAFEEALTQFKSAPAYAPDGVGRT